jgi:hypothetical protein
MPKFAMAIGISTSSRVVMNLQLLNEKPIIFDYFAVVLD